MRRPFIIGIAGGTCCGKTEVCRKISESVNEKSKIITLEHTDFYRKFTDEEKSLAEIGKFDYDHPNAFDDELIINSLKHLKDGKSISIRKYNYASHSHEENKRVIAPADVILFEGILVLYNKEVRDLLDMKIFVDADCDERLARRVMRDTTERQREMEHVLTQYTTYVKRSFEDFSLPTKRYADVIIPRGAGNTVAVDLIVQHIHNILFNVGHRRKRNNSENSLRLH